MIFVYPAIISPTVDDRYLPGITRTLEQYYLNVIGQAFEMGTIRLAQDEYTTGRNSDIRLECELRDNSDLQYIAENMILMEETRVTKSEIKTMIQKAQAYANNINNNQITMSPEDIQMSIITINNYISDIQDRLNATSPAVNPADEASKQEVQDAVARLNTIMISITLGSTYNASDDISKLTSNQLSATEIDDLESVIRDANNIKDIRKLSKEDLKTINDIIKTCSTMISDLKKIEILSVYDNHANEVNDFVNNVSIYIEKDDLIRRINSDLIKLQNNRDKLQNDYAVRYRKFQEYEHKMNQIFELIDKYREYQKQINNHKYELLNNEFLRIKQIVGTSALNKNNVTEQRIDTLIKDIDMLIPSIKNNNDSDKNNKLSYLRKAKSWLLQYKIDLDFDKTDKTDDQKYIDILEFSENLNNFQTPEKCDEYIKELNSLLNMIRGKRYEDSSRKSKHLDRIKNSIKRLESRRTALKNGVVSIDIQDFANSLKDPQSYDNEAEINDIIKRMNEVILELKRNPSYPNRDIIISNFRSNIRDYINRIEELKNIKEIQNKNLTDISYYVNLNPESYDINSMGKLDQDIKSLETKLISIQELIDKKIITKNDRLYVVYNDLHIKLARMKSVLTQYNSRADLDKSNSLYQQLNVDYSTSESLKEAISKIDTEIARLNDLRSETSDNTVRLQYQSNINTFRALRDRLSTQNKAKERAAADRSVSGFSVNDKDEFNIRPSMVTASVPVFIYDRNNNVKTETKQVAFGVKILNIKAQGSNNMFKVLTADMYSNTIFYLYKGFVRSFLRSIINSAPIRLMANIWSSVFGSRQGTNAYKDILLTRKGYIDASTFRKKPNAPKYNYYGAGIVIMSDMDLKEEDHNFFDDTAKIQKLFKLGWNSFVIMNERSSKLTFCSYLENGMCTRIPYAYLYKKGEKLYDSLDSLKSHVGNVMGRFKRVNYKKIR